jgi:hypothetical protein
MLIGFGAIHVIAVDEFSIWPEQHARRAWKHRAKAFLVCTSVQILDGARCVHAHNLAGIILQRIPVRKICVNIAIGYVVATFVAVFIDASPTCAWDADRFGLQVVVIRTFERYAQVFLCAALVEVGLVSAVSVVTEDVGRVPPQRIFVWTIKHAAVSIFPGAGIQILDGTRSILATDFRCIELQDIHVRWFPRVAQCYWIAACVPIFIMASPIVAVQKFLIPLWNVADWAMECKARFCLCAAFVVICSRAAVLVITQNVLSIVSQHVILGAFK